MRTSTPTITRRIKKSRSYYTIKARLIDALGGSCEICGSIEKLEFNHKYGRTWEPRMVCYADRMRRYRREALAGEINLLCQRCNRYYWPISRDVEVCPF